MAKFIYFLGISVAAITQPANGVAADVHEDSLHIALNHFTNFHPGGYWSWKCVPGSRSKFWKYVHTTLIYGQ